MTDTTLQNQRLAKRYDAASAGWHRKISDFGFPMAYQMLAKNGLPQAGTNVIDLGTGCGDFALAYLAVHCAPALFTLLDISKNMLTVAEKKISVMTANLASHLGAIDTLNVDQKYDVALCAHVIEHCPSPQNTLNAIFDHLKPGGTLLLAVSKPHWCTALIRLIWRNKAFSPAKVGKMLAAAGFTEIIHHPFPSGPPQRVSAGYSAQKPVGKPQCL